jgi:hypothetical protein
LEQLLIDSEPESASLPQLLESRKVRLFYGDLHNHTAFSDGMGRPEDALRLMRDRGLHFAAITDHGEFYDRHTDLHNSNNWTATADAVAAQSGPDFLAIRGFEWSSWRQGHSNVWWSTEFNGFLRTGDESMRPYYDWLSAAHPVEGVEHVLAGFNHPCRESGCFDQLRLASEMDSRIVTLECFNRDDDYGEAYYRALDNGWRLGAIGVSDHHGDDWGNSRWPRAGIFASELTIAGIQCALAARNVFATRSPTLSVALTGNEQLMGARLVLNVGEDLNLFVSCDDGAASTIRSRLELLTNGGELVEAAEMRGLHQATMRVTIPSQPGRERWFLVRVLHGNVVLAYSSPIWARWE